jgi:hypothetical protein
MGSTIGIWVESLIRVNLNGFPDVRMPSAHPSVAEIVCAEGNLPFLPEADCCGAGAVARESFGGAAWPHQRRQRHGAEVRRRAV